MPSLGLLIFTPQDIDLFFRCFQQTPRRTHRLLLTDVHTGTYAGKPVSIAGPMLGAPQTVMVLEKLIALGVSDIVAVGWCGSLLDNVRIGDVVLPTGAVSEEGTSRHYPIPTDRPGPSEALLKPLRESFQKELLTVHEGKVWSTDAPYRETIGKVLNYKQAGILAVDMETSALLTVARFRNIRLAVALIVSDSLSDLTWKHGFKEIRFQQTRTKLAELTLKAVCSAV
ncbi:MAG: nucleoside phosphorylase [Syntrophobacteraceae bacterium]